jgi:hypothetical protein
VVFRKANVEIPAEYPCFAGHIYFAGRVLRETRQRLTFLDPFGTLMFMRIICHHKHPGKNFFLLGT